MAAEVGNSQAVKVRRVRKSLEAELAGFNFDDDVVEWMANSIELDELPTEENLAADWSPFLISLSACDDELQARTICQALLRRLRSEDGTGSTAASDADCAAQGGNATAASASSSAAAALAARSATSSATKKTPQPPPSESIGQELDDWLERLRLSKYADDARAWCERMGAVSLNEVLEHSQDFAAALRLKPLEIKRLDKDIASRADACAPNAPTPSSSSNPPRPPASPSPGPVPESHGSHPCRTFLGSGGYGPVCAGGAANTVRRTFGPPDDPERYTLWEEIGTGATATVHRCCRGDEEFAVKTISLSKLRLQRDFKRISDKLHREVNILFSLRHQGIVTLFDVVEEEGQALHLVMELVNGGELFDKIVERGSFSEPVARYVFLQIVEGLRYIHSKDIVHRDLKPENILVDDKASRHNFLEVKLSDFGHSKLINDGYSTALTRVGTPQYWAPEVSDPAKAMQGYDQTVDLWSLGVVLYVMLVGSYPFDGVNERIEEQIKKASLCFRTQDPGKELSSRAMGLIKSLIKVNPKERLTLDGCLAHPWVTSAANGSVGRVMKLCAEANEQSWEVRLPLPVQPSKDQVTLLRIDLIEWQKQFLFSATVKHQEVILNFGNKATADNGVVERAQQTCMDIINWHFGSDDSCLDAMASGSHGRGRGGANMRTLPTVVEDRSVGSGRGLGTLYGGGSGRSQSFRLIYHTLRVNETDGAGLVLEAEVAGMRITKIFDTPGQPGLQRGDLITKINEVALRGGSSNVEDIFSAHFRDGASLALKRSR